MKPAESETSLAPILGSLFEYAGFGPWIQQLIVAPHVPFRRPDTPFSTEINTIMAHRLAATALAVAKAEDLDLPIEDIRQLRSAEFANSAHSLHARVGGARACAELSRGGIRALVVKGPAIAQCYRRPRLRAYNDLDLLVAPREFGRALRILQDADWRMKETYPRGYFPRWCVEGVNLERDGADQVDLHHHVPPWTWGRGVLFSELWQRGHDLVLADAVVRCASAEDNLLIAALHTVSDRSRPGKTAVIWQDLVELTHAVDIDRLITAAHEARLSGWLAHVLAALPDGSVPVNVTSALAPDPVTHPRRLAALMDVAHTRRRPAREWAARLPALSGLAYVAAVVLPSRTYLRAIQNNARYLPYWRSLVRPETSGATAFKLRGFDSA